MDVMPSWFAVILQGGSFAVLVYLFIWSLPGWRREIAHENDSQLTRFLDDSKQQRKDFTDSLSSAIAVFHNETSAERLACEKHFQALASAVSRGNEATIQAVHTMAEQIQAHAYRNQQWADVLKAEMARQKAEGSR